ncbi:MAG: hypothetical protein MRK00_01590 [Nitrosomonas sp.]|nr:hypothetical protein [Nitrosomonas sp.]
MNNSEPMTPLKPHLTLRVGITGHRHTSKKSKDDDKNNDVLRYPLCEIKRVSQQIRETLEALQGIIIEDIYPEFDMFYSKSPPQFRFFSALAEGVDQEAAKIAIQLDKNPENSKKLTPYTLECILPFSKDEYRKDFSEESLTEFNNLLDNENVAAVFELDGPKDNRAIAYESAGVLMLENIDILIAVWDGNPCSRGGTCAIVEKAQARGIPIVWIQSDTDNYPSFWCYEYGLAKGFVPITEESIYDFKKLNDEIRRLIAPPGLKEEIDKEANKLLKRFFKEEHLENTDQSKVDKIFCNFGKLYKKFRDVIANKECPYKSNTEEPDETDDWKRFFDCPETGLLKSQVKDRLHLNHNIIDAEAVFCANQYRSSYIAMFLMAGVAIAVGLLAIFSSDWFLKGVWTIIELLIILSITQILNKGNKNHWHQRFLDARMIAEQLRHARFLTLAGRSAGGVRRSVTGETPSERMTEWYIRAILRELAIPNIRVDKNYIKEIKKTMTESELKGPNGQIFYNEYNYVKLNSLDHRLHKCGEGLFWATFWICGIYLIFLFLYWQFLSDIPEHYASLLKNLKNTFTYFAAVCPSFAAALSGIRYQGDFKAFAARSLATKSQLEEICKILDNENRVINLSAVGNRFKTCADIMAHDIGAWRMIYNHRPLETPG